MLTSSRFKHRTEEEKKKTFHFQVIRLRDIFSHLLNVRLRLKDLT